MALTEELIRSLPKVALHDHLDGGLRAVTVLELSREHGLLSPGAFEFDADDAVQDTSIEPATDSSPTSEQVAIWFHAAADSGSLPAYLSTFDRTLAVMQTAPDLRRIAREFVADMVADGVVYAETRWAPHQHTEDGLSLDEAVQAVQDGLDEGVAAAQAAGKRIVVGQLLCYLRHLEPTDDLVEIATARQGSGVVGIDLAGPEAGFPASRFRSQFARARELGVRVTIHAGEADGPASIADALDCGAERIGHGVRIIEDIAHHESTASHEDPAEQGRAGGEPSFGPVAARVHAQQICLEVCPSSNLQTGAAATMAEHPVGPLHAAGFSVALSSDNRLMSRTSTTREMRRAAEAFGWTLADLEQITLTGLEAGFAESSARAALRDDVVLPAFAAARSE